ncbi:SpoIID/LytB domain protein [Friedmanniella luteola]|uniref:SpoIID/LytB domain protein n=1 Tax=Friedmanniella luteola TaxID=546871 RepID=A0A1H1VDT6_9ACTN|nr:SpoIID/LytB domain-containing protein [Friedmanniella luteola]SDS82369.1 SpoIID/LytB domain protein [Friedmanniella luteola]
MSSPTRAVTTVRSRAGRLWGGAVALSLLTSLTLLFPPTAAADSAVAPARGSFTIRGAGFGHGHGMSQYGAYGAAQQGRTWKQILAFYYPGTTLTTMPTGTTIKVLLTADSDGDLRVQPTKGLQVRDGEGGRYTVPTGAAHTSWRISRKGDGYQLASLDAAGTWKTRATGLGGGTWSFSSSAKVLTLVRPGGSTRAYRGSLALVRNGSGGRTVNTVLLEDYVRAVVPVEMPTSWAADAVRSQAVAARSYAVRTRDFSDRPGYDICDTDTCQVYGGKRAETGGGDAAVKATAGRVVSQGGRVALTQFASSNGGALAASNLPYLVAKADPYDGVITSQAWSRTLTAAAISRSWPSVGTVQRLQVTRRDGSGAWGGRVEKITVTGSKGSVTVGGETFQYRFGMRSSLFTVAGASTGGTAPTPPPPAPTTLEPGPAYASHPRTYSSASRADLLLVSGSTLRRYPVVRGVLQPPVTLGTGYGSATHVLNAGDWNGDGYQDVITRSGDGTLLLRRGSSTGRLAAGVDMRFGGGIRTLAAVGDVTGDRRPDLVSISPAGNLWLHAGDGRTGRARLTKLASGWQDRDALRGPGDLTGDGRPDLLTARGDRLYLHRGTTGGFGAAVSLGTGWSAYPAITAVGDLTGDGRGDVVARTQAGELMLFRGDGKGGLGAGTTLAGRYSGTRFAL